MPSSSTGTSGEDSRSPRPLSTAQYAPYIWLMGAVLFSCFADGKYTIAVAAWLFPAFMLRFIRLQRPWPGLGVAFVAMAIVRGIVFHGMIPLPGALFYVFAVISSLIALIPFALDRLFAPRLKGIWSALVFPTALVSTQFLYEHGPFGSWGSTAYTQAGNLALLQILALTGLSGVTFFIGWFAGTFNFVLSSAGRRAAITATAVFGLSILLVLTAGEARLALSPPSAQAVRIAAQSPPDSQIGTGSALFAEVAGGKASWADTSSFQTAAKTIQANLIARSDREAKGGAKIILWSETAALVLKVDENQLLSAGASLAVRDHVYLGMALGTITPGAPHPLENKIVMITPDGKTAWQYIKTHPTPGPEAAIAVPSDGRLRFLDTPFGRLTAAICYDTDFPALMKQAGIFQADIVLSPANDWRDVDPRHTQMAQFRAIEQGVNLVRATSDGLSAGYDFEGNPLAISDAYRTPDHILLAQIPTRGVRTPYTYLGDWLAWLSLVILLGLIVTGAAASNGRGRAAP